MVFLFVVGLVLSIIAFNLIFDFFCVLNWTPYCRSSAKLFILHQTGNIIWYYSFSSLILKIIWVKLHDFHLGSMKRLSFMTFICISILNSHVWLQTPRRFGCVPTSLATRARPCARRGGGRPSGAPAVVRKRGARMRWNTVRVRTHFL